MEGKEKESPVFSETQLRCWEENLRSREKNLDQQDDLDYVSKQIEWLRSQESETQKSDAWIIKRQTMITASDVYKCLGTPALLCSLVRDKCVSKPVQIKAAALDHGVTFEPVARKFYEFLRNTEVAEFGCLRHRNHEFIGASPDGVVVDPQSPFFGRLLEIKVPKSRELCFTSLDIPRAYMVQMQIQMEVADLPRCDYLECKIEHFLSKADFVHKALEFNEYKGVYCVATNQVVFYGTGNDFGKSVIERQEGGSICGHESERKDEDCERKSEYIREKNQEPKEPKEPREPHESQEPREHHEPTYQETKEHRQECMMKKTKRGDNNEFLQEQEEVRRNINPIKSTSTMSTSSTRPAEQNLESFLQTCETSSTIYFHLKEHFLCTVEREPAWFRSWLPKIESTWQKIVNARLDSNLIVQPKKRASPPKIHIDV